MSRRLKGCAIRCLETGGWYPGDTNGGYWCPKEKRALVKLRVAHSIIAGAQEPESLRIVKVYSVPKGSKPSPCPCPSGTCPTCMGADDEPEPKPAPVVAGEGRYACLDLGGVRFAELEHLRSTGTRAEALETAALVFGVPSSVPRRAVRILADGEHEAAVAAAVEAAVRAERERVLPLLAALEDVASDIAGDYTPEMLVAHMHRVARAALAAHEAQKGQAK